MLWTRLLRATEATRSSLSFSPTRIYMRTDTPYRHTRRKFTSGRWDWDIEQKQLRGMHLENEPGVQDVEIPRHQESLGKPPQKTNHAGTKQHSSISPVHTRAFNFTLLFDSSARAVTTVKYNSRHTRDMHWEYAYGPHLCRQHRRPQAPNTHLVTPACFTLTPQREASSRDGIHPKASHLAQPLRSRVPPPEAVPQYKGGWAGQTFGPASSGRLDPKWQPDDPWE